MNNYRKLSADAWGIQCDAPQEPGAVVTVTTKAGKVKRVTLGARAPGFRTYEFVYAIADTPRPEAVAVGDLSGLLALFDKAAKRLKYPCIELTIDPLEPALARRSIRLNVAGPTASVPGSLTVLTSERDTFTDRRTYLGRVLREGTFQPARECMPEVAPRLAELARDPAKVASEQGRLTGRCCFCRLPLTDARSTAVGYGETCASNYGLPWGEERASFAA